MANLPKEMRAVVITQPGDPDVLKVQSRPVPEAKPGEVLVKVAAAGVNRPDIEQRRGRYPAPPGVSADVPGLEIAGEVVALGANATKFKIGDKVTALVGGAGYAEYCTAPEPQALAVPRGMDMVAAAAIPETFFTVWQNVFDRGRLKAGETILIHGGSSGIGTTAIQLAKAMGARVLATAGTDEKCAACVKLGAERAINYKTEDFAAVVKESTKDGVDVILDMLGGSYFPRNIASLAIEGRLCLIALLGGPKSEIDVSTVLRRRLTITGSTLRPRTIAEKGAVATQLASKVWPLFEAKTIAPVIDRTYKLEDAAAAHARIESSEHIGKIVLTI